MSCHDNRLLKRSDKTEGGCEDNPNNLKQDKYTEIY